jgi:hypothetical protein
MIGRNAVIDASMVAKWLEESNDEARKLSRENHDAWVGEIEKIRIAVGEGFILCWN